MSKPRRNKSFHNHTDDLQRGQRIEDKQNHPDGANKRSVWSISTAPFKDAHFATFPVKLIEPMILAGCREGGIVLDPFMGAGTTAIVARKLGRQYIGIELNKAYIKIAKNRLRLKK